MKISSTPPSPLSCRASAAPSAPRRDGGGFFGAMQGSLRNGYLEISICELFKPVVDTETGRFAVETAIGDDAVRFDARPILAPTGASGGAATGTGAPGAASTGQPAATDAPPHAALADLVAELAERLPVIAARAAIPQGEAARSALLFPVSSGPPPTPASSIAAASPARHRETAGAAPGRVGAAAALRYLPDLGRTAARTSAQVTALPRDVVVVLRGVSLSFEEGSMLSEKMRAVLAEHRLGDRTIRIMGIEARS